MPSEVWEEVTYPFPMDNQFHATFYDGCYYLFMLGLELINNSKRVSRYTIHLTLHILCWLSLGYSECTPLDPVSIYRPPFQSWDFRYPVRRSYIYNENPNVGIHIEPVPLTSYLALCIIYLNWSRATVNSHLKASNFDCKIQTFSLNKTHFKMSPVIFCKNQCVRSYD